MTADVIEARTYSDPALVQWEDIRAAFATLGIDLDVTTISVELRNDVITIERVRTLGGGGSMFVEIGGGLTTTTQIWVRPASR